MIGLVGGIMFACLAFYLVLAKFDSRLWVAGLAALVVLVGCALTGILGVVLCAVLIGALFKADF